MRSNQVPRVVAGGGGVISVAEFDFTKESLTDTKQGIPLTFSRASAAWLFNSSGLLKQAAVNTPRYNRNQSDGSMRGLLVEEQRTNLLLQSRDLTTGAWTTSAFASTARNQVGIDGASNSASTYTSSGLGPATCTQNVTSASAARVGSVFLKLISGSGAVEISIDGGSTYTNVTSLLNGSTWTRVKTPSQTLTNPSFVLRLGTSTSVAVDCVQLETGTFVTTPIITAATQVTRAVDICSLTGDSFQRIYRRGQPLSAFVEAINGPVTGVSSRFLHFNSAGSAQVSILQGASGSSLEIFVTDEVGSNIYSTSTASSVAEGGLCRIAASLTIGEARVANNSRAYAQIGGRAGPPPLSQIHFGDINGAIRCINSELRKVSIYQGALSASHLRGLCE